MAQATSLHVLLFPFSPDSSSRQPKTMQNTHSSPECGMALTAKLANSIRLSEEILHCNPHGSFLFPTHFLFGLPISRLLPHGITSLQFCPCYPLSSSRFSPMSHLNSAFLSKPPYGIPWAQRYNPFSCYPSGFKVTGESILSWDCNFELC